METSIQTTTKNTPLAAGFQDPVHNAQACFRAIMDVMARPGSRKVINTHDLKPPAPLTPVAAMPEMNCFCMKRKTMMIGKADRNDAAMTTSY